MRALSPMPALGAMLLIFAATAPGAFAAATASPAPARTPAADILTYRGDAGRDGNMPGPGPLGKASVAWVFQAGGPFASQPMVQDGVVYTVSNEGTLHAIDLASAASTGARRSVLNSTGSPLLLDGHVLVATDDGLHSISMADGSLAWKTSATQPLKGSPVLDRRPRGRGGGGWLGERGRPGHRRDPVDGLASARAWTRVPPRPRTRSWWARRPARSWRSPRPMARSAGAPTPAMAPG